MEFSLYIGGGGGGGGCLGSKLAVPGLIQALEDNDYQVRWQVVDALGEIGSREAIPALIKVLDDDEYSVRWAATEALGKFGIEQAIPGLVRASEVRDSDMRFTAATLLGRFSTKQATSGLLKIILNDYDAQVCWRATKSLKSIGSELVVPEVLKVLEEKNLDKSWKLQYIYEALGELGADQAIPALLKGLTNDCSELRRSAAKALGNLGAEQAIPGLVQALTDEDSRVRQNAIIALGCLGADQTIPKLCKSLEDEAPRVRLSTAITLGKLGSNQGIPEFLTILQDESWLARFSVINGLERINNTSIASMLPYLMDLIPKIGEFAVMAIETIQSNCKFYNYDIAQTAPPNIFNRNQDSQGITNMAIYNFDQRGANIGVNVASEGSTIQFIQQAKQNINCSEQKLAEAAKDIEDLLTQLNQTYPITNESQQQAFIQKFLEQLNSTPKLIKILLAGGVEGLKILCPLAGIPIEMASRLYEVVQQKNNYL